MNDYKELIEDLRHYFYDTELVLDAADAIEQLVKERDAAMADLKDAAAFPCRFCKKEHTEDCDCYTAHDKWEWRGVQEADDETD